MTSAETRLLRYLHAAGAHLNWVPYSTILNTEDLLPGNEKALPTLFACGLIEKEVTEPAYRVSNKGTKALARSSRDAG